MRHFVQEMEIDKLSIKDDNFNIHAIVAELVQQPAAFGTLNDMLVQHSNSHLQLHDASKLPVNVVNITVWYYLDPYHLAGVCTDFFLDDDHIVYLTETYKVLNNLSANLEHISFYTKKHSKIMFVNNVYGSQHSQSKRSSYIMAAWCGMDGKVDSITTDLRPGRVLFYFKHCLTIGQRVVPHIFAFVQWYQHHPLQHHVASSRIEIWCANLFEPFGPAYFLPVQKIHSQLWQHLTQSTMNKCFMCVLHHRKYLFENHDCFQTVYLYIFICIVYFNTKEKMSTYNDIHTQRHTSITNNVIF